MANAETNSGRGKGYGWRLSLGMLLPSSNPVAEPELTRMLPEGFHSSRPGSSSQAVAVKNSWE